MILKTSLRNLILALSLGMPNAQAQGKLSRFECMVKFMSISDRGSFQRLRQFFEAPFLSSNKYLVFPEVRRGQVAGFYVYDESHAWHYDAVEFNGQKQAISKLRLSGQMGVLELTAQPNGLETISIPFLPNYSPLQSGADGPVILGSSVLPVVGAFVSRPREAKRSYSDPSQLSEAEVKNWVKDHSSRRPASDDEPKTIMRLSKLKVKVPVDLWAPVKRELKIRREWVKGHNIDERTFKKLTPVLNDSCQD